MKLPIAMLILAAGLGGLGGEARAAELRVFTGGSMAEPLRIAGEDFTRATGMPLRFVMGTTGVISQKVRAGEPADVIVISAEGLTPLQAAGLTTSEAPVPLAKAIFGAAVRAGAPRPDISTAGKFREVALRAASVAYPDPALGATAGVYLTGLFEKLGIADAMRAKSHPNVNGAETASAVASGQAELGLTFISELLPNPGVQVIGAFPAAIQSPMLYAAAVSSHAADPAAARAFIAFVTSPAERARLKAAGVEPAAP